jgi:tRNA dimethylallyltransferase
LHEKLKKIDAVAALKIHPNDTKRVIRALEVFETTGKPISQMQKERSGGFSKDYSIKIFCLNLKRSALYRRIEKRVDAMFKRGILEEVKKLLSMPLSKTAYYAIGIRELEGYFAGRYDLEEAKKLIKRNTRLYAKRQLTWFRKDKRIGWVKIKDKDTPQEIARGLWKKHC